MPLQAGKQLLGYLKTPLRSVEVKLPERLYSIDGLAKTVVTLAVGAVQATGYRVGVNVSLLEGMYPTREVADAILAQANDSELVDFVGWLEVHGRTIAALNPVHKMAS